MLVSWIDGRRNVRTSKDEVKLPTGPERQVPERSGEATPLKEKCQDMERNSQDEIKAHLMQTDEHFRKLVAQHNEYKRLVEALESKPVLSAEEELEEHRLKKLKLHLKDQMETALQSAYSAHA